MKKIGLIALFLFINFSALGIGSLLMMNGPMTSWYLELNKAPWTPPGWVFGVAWTTIMICFSIYMAYLISLAGTQKLKILFIVQFVLNISWNYFFFNQHLISVALINIVLLTLLTFYFLFNYLKKLKIKSVLILPYCIWLCIATSLNLYILLNN